MLNDKTGNQPPANLWLWEWKSDASQFVYCHQARLRAALRLMSLFRTSIYCWLINEALRWQERSEQILSRNWINLLLGWRMKRETRKKRLKSHRALSKVKYLTTFEHSISCLEERHYVRTSSLSFYYFWWFSRRGKKAHEVEQKIAMAINRIMTHRLLVFVSSQPHLLPVLSKIATMMAMKFKSHSVLSQCSFP